MTVSQAPKIECEHHHTGLLVSNLDERDLHGYVMSFGHRLQEPCKEGEDQK